jgi:hypothetical protein
VANAFGSEQSSNAVLSVGVPPSIVIQPVSQTVRLGGSATFEVAAAGTEPLAYQWSLGTTNLAAATNSVLVITNVQRRDVGSYTVVVSNAFGVASSSNATLLVYAVDHFTWDPIPSPRFLNVPFSVRIQALDATNGLITGFTGRVALRSTAGVSVNPSTSGDFVQGEWTGSMTVAQAATNAILVAADDSGDLGYANPIDVVSIPSLSIDPSGSSVLLSWPAGVPAFVLETTSDFASWSQVTTPIGLTGDKYEVRLRTSGTKAFYRLRFVPPTGGQ